MTGPPAATRQAGAATRPAPDATEALVAKAALADGTPAVLKVLIPRAGDQARSEITVLELAGGQGCVSLVRADLASRLETGLMCAQIGLPPGGRQMLEAAERVAP